MKIVFFILFSSIFGFSYSQTVLLNEDFESYQDFTISNIGSWQTLDLDLLNTWTLGGDPAPPTNWVANWPNANAKMAYQIFNPSVANVTNDATGVTGEIRNFDPHSGNKYAGSWAGVMVASGQGNNDWLISPAVTLGSTGNVLKLWVKTLSLSYGNERYRVGVYLGNGTPTTANNFTIISTPASTYSLAPQNWTEITFNLDAYSAQTIRIGVQCLTQEGSMLMIDDVKITTTGFLGTNESKTKYDVIVYPNPIKSLLTVESKSRISDLKLFSLDGKLIENSNTNEMDLSRYSSGNYLLEVRFDDNNTIVKKIIKQ